MKNTLVNVEGAVACLNLKPTTIRASALRRKIAYVKLGRAVRIRLSDLETIIQAGTIPARSDSQYRKTMGKTLQLLRTPNGEQL